jgi:hypothetical protein
VLDGDTFTVLLVLNCVSPARLVPFKSVDGSTRLLVVLSEGTMQLWDAEEGRLLRDGMHAGNSGITVHILESAEGRHLLGIMSYGNCHPHHPGDTRRSFLDLWDMGEAPARAGALRPAHRLG